MNYRAFKTAGSEAGVERQALAVVLDTLREAVLIVNKDLKIASFNKKAEIAFGLAPRELTKRRLSECIRDLALHEAFESALAGGQVARVRLEVGGKEERVYEVRIAPMELDGSRLAAGVFYDITQVEHLEKVRQVFLSNISHELRTPLTSILAFVETLEDGAIDDDENNRRFLGVIRKNAERMRLLIDDISELSSIESGNVTIKPEGIRLSQLVDEVLASLSANAEDRDVAMKNTVPANARVCADPVRLGQMLTNLVDNAIKFNRRKGTVTVAFVENGAANVIEVADTGEGCSRDHRQRIFERFYRIDRSRSREVGGTGLGLAIVKHLARLHGGKVSVSSIPGEGSRFRIELPQNPATND